MKQTIIDIVKILVACIVAIVVTMGVDALGIGYRYGHVAVFFCAAIAMCGVLGVFRDPAKRENLKHNSMRHRMGGRSYGQAAVFVGAACVFMGTPQDCEDLCDELWHHGQQAHVQMLSGEETNFKIL